MTAILKTGEMEVTGKLRGVLSLRMETIQIQKSIASSQSQRVPILLHRLLPHYLAIYKYVSQKTVAMQPTKSFLIYYREG